MKDFLDRVQLLYMIADYFNLTKDDAEVRKRLRRTVYLLQMYGVKVGYGWSWGKYAPFSSDLIEDSIHIASLSGKRKKEIEKLSFSEKSLKKLDKVKEICTTIWKDVDMLELIGCVDFAKTCWYKNNKDIFKKARKEHMKKLSSGTKITDKMLHEALFFYKCLKGEKEFDPEYNIPFTRFELMDLEK